MLQDFILSVVADNEGNRDAVMGGGPEALDAVERGSVAKESQHRALRPGELDPERTAKAPAERPAAMPEVPRRVREDAQPGMHPSIIVGSILSVAAGIVLALGGALLVYLFLRYKRAATPNPADVPEAIV